MTFQNKGYVRRPREQQELDGGTCLTQSNVRRPREQQELDGGTCLTQSR